MFGIVDHHKKEFMEIVGEHNKEVNGCCVNVEYTATKLAGCVCKDAESSCYQGCTQQYDYKAFRFNEDTELSMKKALLGLHNS